MHRDLQGLRSKITGVASRVEIFLNYQGKKLNLHLNDTDCVDAIFRQIFII